MSIIVMGIIILTELNNNASRQRSQLFDDRLTNPADIVGYLCVNVRFVAVVEDRIAYTHHVKPILKTTVIISITISIHLPF